MLYRAFAITIIAIIRRDAISRNFARDNFVGSLASFLSLLDVIPYHVTCTVHIYSPYR